MFAHYTFWWILWLAQFPVIEGYALWKHRGQGYTLSEHVWAWFGIRPHGKAFPRFVAARRIALALFMGWLMLHFLSGSNHFLATIWHFLTGGQF